MFSAISCWMLSIIPLNARHKMLISSLLSLSGALVSIRPLEICLAVATSRRIGPVMLRDSQMASKMLKAAAVTTSRMPSLFNLPVVNIISS
ncbi:hypothetical protein D3C76_1632810 [compost metagenome]